MGARAAFRELATGVRRLVAGHHDSVPVDVSGADVGSRRERAPEGVEPSFRADAGRPSWRELGAAAILYLAATWAYLGPSIGSIVGRLGPDLGDPRFNLYLLAWVGRWLETAGAVALWSPPFFHPTAGVLAYSDHLIGPGVVLAALGRLGVPPVTAFNLLFLGTFVLAGTTAFWLARRVGAGVLAGLVAGWLVAFSHLRWTEISHFQVLRAQWIPVVLWTFDRCLVRPGWRTALPFLAAYLLHVSGGSYLTWIVHVPMLVLLLVRMREAGWRRFLGGGRAPRLAATAGGALLVLAPFVHGYLDAWSTGILERPAWEARSNGAILVDLARPSHDALVHGLGLLPGANGRFGLFPGFVALAGLAAALAPALRRAVRSLDGRARLRRGGAVVAGLGLVGWGLTLADRVTLGADAPGWLVALGLSQRSGARALIVVGGVVAALALRGLLGRPQAPPGGVAEFRRALWIAGAIGLVLALPVGFEAVRSWVPGLDGMRVPHRFLVVASLALALAVALALECLSARLRRPAARALVGLLVLAAVAIESTPRRWSWVEVPERAEEFPAYARFLATEPTVGAYVEAPLLGDYRETERMWAQTLHWKPMVNGYSARFAGSYQRTGRAFDPFPDDEGLDRLRRSGVTHLVAHRLPTRRGGRNRLMKGARAAVAAGRIVPRFAGGETTVYEILPSRGSPGRSDSAPAPEPDKVRR